MSDKQDGTLPIRKRPAHGVLRILGQPVIVFITACTKDRAKWLADPTVHDHLRSAWSATPGWRVGRYVIMPDHVHLFASPEGDDVSLDDWMHRWKAEFRRLHGDPRRRWQAGHWDRRLRRSESYHNKWHYVRENPVRHGLVADSDDWPHQGEIHAFWW